MTDLGFARIALMVGNADLVEEVMELTDDRGHLLGEVTGIHDGSECSDATVALVYAPVTSGLWRL